MPKIGFNLLRPQLSPPTAWDKIYQWMLGTARIIVIIVQIIVIAAFAVRIYVDTVSRQLDEEIDKKDVILSSLEPREEQIRDVQLKSGIYTELWEQSSSSNRYVTLINNLIRGYDGLLSVNVNKTSILISGEMNEDDIADLEDRLKERELPSGQDYDPTSGNILFDRVTLTDVESDESGIASFSIQIELIAIELPNTNRQIVNNGTTIEF